VAECTLYLWDYTEKIIVSDIDGTITRLVVGLCVYLLVVLCSMVSLFIYG